MMSSEPSVAILLCTYRGENYLPRQLETITIQTHRRWCLYVSDDGSDDRTLPLLRAFRRRHGGQRVHLFEGPRQGFAANFFSLIARAEVDADYVTFTDQDDEWDERKLERALSALSRIPAEVPALYGSSSLLIDGDGRSIGRSRIFKRAPGFANALVQNMVTGNTMVLNRAALELLRRAGTNVRVSAHDWWTYLLVTGHGGVMVYDPEPTIRYRQHDRNLYGANVSIEAMCRRAARLFRGDYRDWNALNLAALRSAWHLLSDSSRHRVERFERARSAPRALKCFYLFRSGVYRQTWDGQLGLIVAALSNRI